MTAYNAARFKVKSGQENAFIDFHKSAAPLPGMVDGSLINTGDRAYCFVAKWKDFDSIAAARPQMIAMLDQVRGMLEDPSNGHGVTDPVSGKTVAEFTVN